MRKVSNGESKGFWTSIIKGVLTAISITLIGILLFALFIKFVGVKENIIPIVNQVIKVISILFGVWSALKLRQEKGLLRGIMIGLIYTVIAYALFSLLSKQFEFSIKILNDIVFGAAIGAISAVFGLVFKKPSYASVN